MYSVCKEMSYLILSAVNGYVQKLGGNVLACADGFLSMPSCAQMSRIILGKREVHFFLEYLDFEFFKNEPRRLQRAPCWTDFRTVCGVRSVGSHALYARACRECVAMP